MANRKTWLVLVFSAGGLSMFAMTVCASLDRAIWNAGPELLGDRWFQATLLDAYLGFITFYVWVAYKEQTAAGRVSWFLLIMGLGNMAMAAYVLWQLARWKEGDGAAGLLLRRPSTRGGRDSTGEFAAN